MANREVIFDKKVAVDSDQENWSFVVYQDGTHTLLDPDGKAIPAMDYFDWQTIQHWLGEANG